MKTDLLTFAPLADSIPSTITSMVDFTGNKQLLDFSWRDRQGKFGGKKHKFSSFPSLQKARQTLPILVLMKAFNNFPLY